MSGIVMKGIFFRPVILYSIGEIGLFSMLFWMLVRICIMAALVSWAMYYVAQSEGVFTQDGNRPDPSTAAKAKQDAEARAFKGHGDMSAAEYREAIK